MLQYEYSGDKPEFLMLVGLPGSGKSTYIKKYFNQNLRVHSSDDIREELSGDVNNQDINKQVFELLHKRVKEDLRNGISCVYDATNISWKRRKAFLEELNSIDCWKVCHIIATPFEVCLEQNRQRDRKVPYEVIERMYKNFDIPWWNEGWDDIEVWYEDKDYKCAYGNWAEFIEHTMSINQDSKWHTETLGVHCNKCYEYVKEKEDNVSALIWNELRIASALHDCGKPFTQTYKDSKGNDSEYAHYYNHENVGSYNSLFYCDTKDEYYDRLSVAALIRWHMVLHFFKDWEQKTVDKYEREFTEHKFLKEMEFYKALKLLHEGDKNAH
jgi:predicted kinase